MRFGLLKYDYGIYKDRIPSNFGNEIQSIAASYFLPQLDFFLDREATRNISSHFVGKVIMNGWWMHDPKQWPPSDKIDPLFISVHLANKKTLEVILSNENINYLLKHSPIGTRDLYTLKLLKEYNVPAYFSGCLTLTLPKNPYIEKKDYILCVDVKQEVVKKIKESTNKTVYSITPVFNANDLETIGKFQYAFNLLNAYQSSSAVITSRLHVAMPCLALETPVLLLDDSNGKDGRFWGLSNLLRNSNTDWYLKNMDFFDYNNPTKNSNDYISLRNKLISQCESFTGCKQRKISPILGFNSLEEYNINNIVISNDIGKYHKYRKKSRFIKYLSKWI